MTIIAWVFEETGTLKSEVFLSLKVHYVLDYSLVKDALGVVGGYCRFAGMDIFNT
jgi:hypothetical protein